jgi:hypothetical protein
MATKKALYEKNNIQQKHSCEHKFILIGYIQKSYSSAQTLNLLYKKKSVWGELDLISTNKQTILTYYC